MITTEAVGLAISVAGGLIKLVGKADAILAEKAAVQGDIAVGLAALALQPPAAQMIEDLKGLSKTPDALGDDLAGLTELLEEAAPSANALFKYYQKFFPRRALSRVVDGNTEFIKALRAARADLNLEDESVRLAAFYIAPGNDDRRTGYVWRISMSVVDVLAQFGSENTALFLRDEKLQGLVGAVLTRFARSSVDQADSWSTLLRTALKATLNGALDSAGGLSGDNRWMSALLDALSDAREAADDPDEFLLGLFRGKGYPVLVGHLLEAGARELDEEGSGAWRDVAVAVLETGASTLKDSPTFEAFFKDHWGDLLRAGTGAIATHGPALLKGKSPVLREVLVSMTETLAATPNATLLSTDTLVGLADAAIGVVARHPELIEKKVHKEWVAAWCGSVVKVVANAGLRETFSAEGVEALLRSAVSTLGRSPELLVKHPGLVQDLVGKVLLEVAEVPGYGAQDLATAAVVGALGAIEAAPPLADKPYAPLVASLAGRVAAAVKEKKLTALEGKDLIGAAVGAVADNPELLAKAEGSMAEAVVAAVVRVAGGNQRKILAGAVLGETAKALVLTLSRKGAKLAAKPAEEVVKTLAGLLEAGLAVAAKELGTRVGMRDVPPLAGALVAAALEGKVPKVDPADPAFQEVVLSLALEVTR